MKSTEINMMYLLLAVFFMFGCKSSSLEPEGIGDDQELEPVPATVISVNSGTTLDNVFWEKVESALDTGSVSIVFAVGEYILASSIVLTDIGHPDNLLTLQAESAGNVIFDGDIASLLVLDGCKNMRVRGLKFTGNASGYAMRVVNSQRISIEDCYFQDLPAVGYGALGIHQSETDRILVKNCRFERVGYDSHAHMIYAAYGVTRLSVISCYFKDCSGSFVRFRGDLSDQGVVYKSDFISTGTYLTGVNPVFIEIPVFNDVDPGDERMGTNFMVADNTFSYGNMGNQSTRYAMVFHSSGFNPTDRTYLLSTTDGTTLANGTVAEKKTIMSAQLGLDGDRILFGNNANINVEYDVIYRCWNNYGSDGPWTGIADIGSAVNSSGLATSEEEALEFYP